VSEFEEGARLENEGEVDLVAGIRSAASNSPILDAAAGGPLEPGDVAEEGRSCRATGGP